MLRRNNPVDIRYKANGFTLVEIAVTIALLTIVLPAATLMFTTVFTSFKTLSDQTNLTQKSNFALNKFQTEIQEQELVDILDIWTEPEDLNDISDKNHFIYTNVHGDTIGFKIAAEMVGTPGKQSVLMNKFQHCKDDCNNLENWYDLADDEDLVPSFSNEILYFVDGMDDRYEPVVDDYEDISYIALSLIFRYQDQDVPYDIVLNIK